jgi:uncharacterized protein YecE (DUF72 family)
MAVKASRYLTHVLRLNHPEEPVRLLVERASELGGKLGPILLQLPPTMRIALDRLERTLDVFPDRWRVAVEFRHVSWFTDDVRRVLEARRVALCLADRFGPLTPLWRTADWSYLRFHAGRAAPLPCYGRQALATWVERLSDQWTPDEDVYVYFNNDPRACALRDAIVFERLSQRAGRRPTRVPMSREVTIA